MDQEQEQEQGLLSMGLMDCLLMDQEQEQGLLSMGLMDCLYISLCCCYYCRC
jgi:hypothetical protein